MHLSNICDTNNVNPMVLGKKEIPEFFFVGLLCAHYIKDETFVTSFYFTKKSQKWLVEFQLLYFHDFFFFC